MDCLRPPDSFHPHQLDFHSKRWIPCGEMSINALFANRHVAGTPSVVSGAEHRKSVYWHGEFVDDGDNTAQDDEVNEFMSNRGYLSMLMRKVSKTGVIYATSRASEYGYRPGAPDWSNLGQGAPECGMLEGQPPRATTIDVTDENINEYSHVNGDRTLRQAIAEYYNHFYRQGKHSKYTWQNVAVTAGGRSGLCRLMTAMSNCNVGYFLPEYTAYSQLLGMFADIAAMPVPHDSGRVFPPASTLRRSVHTLGLGSFLMSNPCNPTGSVLEGKQLEDYVAIAREESCMFMMDEFYSHYVSVVGGAGAYASAQLGLGYPEEGESAFPDKLRSVSSAAYVEDVNSDPICIINGLTKNWRLPGWRVCWVVAPRHCIDVLGSVGSFTDGGAPHPLQVAAAPLLTPSFVIKDAYALQQHFLRKRNVLVKALTDIGFRIESPHATFYIWADLSALPAPLNTSIPFFEACLTHNIICVPGIFFDINPHHRRVFQKSSFDSFVRLSFGPPLESLMKAVEGFKCLIEEAHEANRRGREMTSCSRRTHNHRAHSAPSRTPTMPTPDSSVLSFGGGQAMVRVDDLISPPLPHFPSRTPTDIASRPSALLGGSDGIRSPGAESDRTSPNTIAGRAAAPAATRPARASTRCAPSVSTRAQAELK